MIFFTVSSLIYLCFSMASIDKTITVYRILSNKPLEY